MANPLSNLIARIPRPTPSRTTILFGLYTLVLFLFFFALTFPHGAIARWVIRGIEEEAALRIRFEAVHLVPWAGYRFSGVRILPRESDGAELLGVRSLDIRPTLAGMLRGSARALVFDADVYGGEVAGTVVRGVPGSVDAAWKGIDLGAIPKLQELVTGAWAGRVSGSVSATTGNDVRETDGEGAITLRDASLTGGNSRGFTVPDLTGVAGDATFTLRNGRLEVASLEITGDQLEIEARGQIILAVPFPRSRLNASVTARPIPGNPGIDGLLRIASGGKAPVGGAYKLTVSGTIARPRLR